MKSEFGPTNFMLVEESEGRDASNSDNEFVAGDENKETMNIKVASRPAMLSREEVMTHEMIH